MIDTQATGDEYKKREDEASASLKALALIAASIEERPSGPLCEEDCLTIHAMARVVGRCAVAESNAFDAHAEALSQARIEMEQETAAADFHRRQAAAHAAVSAAIASGELVRQEKCERCPTVADNIVAHHHDYYKPLEVEWLCRPCHGRHHAENGSAV